MHTDRQCDQVSGTIHDHTNTAIIGLDSRLEVSYLNASAQALFNLNPQSVLGMTYEKAFSRSEELLQAIARATGHNRWFTEYEVTIQKHDGSESIVDLTATPVHDNDCIAWLLELQFIGHHLRIKQKEQLQQQYIATQEMMRGLAHEIKNPLGGLRGAAQLLSQRLPDESVREFTEVIISEADRLKDLVDRICAPSQQLHPTRFNIHQVLEHVRRLLIAESNENLTVTQDYDPSIPEINADPDQLTQAILNLARNAAQSIEYRGQIWLRTRTKNNITINDQPHRLVVNIDVIDEGPGIEPDRIRSIFLPLVTSRPEGTGLGLPIAQSLIHQQNGIIECASQPGKTVFSIILPVLDNQG